VGQFGKVARASARGITRKMRVPPQTDPLLVFWGTLAQPRWTQSLGGLAQNRER